MAMLAEELQSSPFVFKVINLSYNNLNFNESHVDYESSMKFMKCFTNYIKITDILSHLDLSGLLFPPDVLHELANYLSVCPNLMGLHLNDIGIHQDEHTFLELLDIFKLDESHNKVLFRSQF